MKRYISFDFLRGCAILGVIGFHILNVAYDYEAVLKADPPIFYYLILIPLAYLGMFDVLFISLSALVNTISVSKQWDKLTRKMAQNGDIEKSTLSLDVRKKIAKKIMKTQTIRGLFIIAMGYISESLLNGLLLSTIVQEGTTLERLHDAGEALFFAQILVMIGLGVIISAAIFLYLKVSDKKKEQIRKTFFTLGILILVITPIFQELYDASGMPRTLYSNWWDRSFFENLGYFLLAPIFIRFTPILPNLSASFFGVWIALMIVDGKIIKKDLDSILYFSLILFLAGMVCGVLEIGVSYEFADFLMPLAGSFLVMVMLLYFIEVRGKGEKFAKKTKFFRRFGIVTLTLWCLQWVAIFPLFILQSIVNAIIGQNVGFLEGPFYNGGLNGWELWGTLIFVFLFFHLILYLWGKVNFIGSFEWITAKLMSRERKDAAERLNLSSTLYNVESIITEGQEFYGRGTKISFFLIFFAFAVVYVALSLL
ncbi:MAG: hypothetical protein ACTSRZ_07735 [Promethearchaeota archaeon]